MDADFQCFSLLDDLPSNIKYVMVLTKADKREGSGGMRGDIIKKLRKEIITRTNRDVPILLTSAESREGGAELWSVLLDSIQLQSSL